MEGDDNFSRTTRSTDGEGLYEQKMRLAQARPYRRAQGTSNAAVALAPGSVSTTLEGACDSTDDKKMAAVLPPGPALGAMSPAQRDDWSLSVDVQSKASVESDPNNEIQGAKRAFVDNMKMPQPLSLTTSSAVTPQKDQRKLQTFDGGEGLSLAPATAVGIRTTMPPRDEAAQRLDRSVDKNRLLIDPRAAPLEGNVVDAPDLSAIEAIVASGREQELTAVSLARPSPTDQVPESRRMRTPAQGYTVGAHNKGSRDHATAPGAIAVAQRNRRPGREGGTGALNSMLGYSGTADENIQRNSHTARNSSELILGSRISSSSGDGKTNEKSGISTRVIWIIFGILVLVIGLGTGLGLGLGGNDKSSTNSGVETDAPSVDISSYQKLVEDFYDDGGIVFEDTKSPQYQALLWLASDPQNESLDKDRIRTLYAVAVLYYATNGDDFMSNATWSERYGFLNSSDSICKWNNGNRTFGAKGLWCDQNTETKVEALSFPSNNLVGAIPEEIGMLKDLQHLVLGSNRLESTLPETLFQLPALISLDLASNSITGLIPSTFPKATNLEILHLGSNQLEGPMSLDHLVKRFDCPLTLVSLAQNKFTGTFPLDSIADNCTRVETIFIYKSGLVIEGGIPPIGLEKLTLLNLGSSGLTGSIPNEISKLRLLRHFYADDNALNGTIPSSLGELTRLTLLSLSGNSLEGFIPSTMGQLQQLTTLDLQSNSLSGSIPSELARCTNLVDVQLDMNYFSGDIGFLCPLPSSMVKLSSDCSSGDVVCSCCTECY